VQSIIRVSTLATFPLLAILAAASDDIIALAGNDDWGPAASVLRIICVAAMVRAMVLVSGPMMGIPARISRRPSRRNRTPTTLNRPP